MKFYKWFYSIFIILLSISNKVFGINSDLTNAEVKLLGYMVDFDQCINNCKLNSSTEKKCRIDCYVDLASIGYKNVFSFGISVDEIMNKINKQLDNASSKDLLELKNAISKNMNGKEIENENDKITNFNPLSDIILENIKDNSTTTNTTDLENTKQEVSKNTNVNNFQVTDTNTNSTNSITSLIEKTKNYISSALAKARDMFLQNNKETTTVTKQNRSLHPPQNNEENENESSKMETLNKRKVDIFILPKDNNDKNNEALIDILTKSKNLITMVEKNVSDELNLASKEKISQNSSIDKDHIQELFYDDIFLQRALNSMNTNTFNSLKAVTQNNTRENEVIPKLLNILTVIAVDNKINGFLSQITNNLVERLTKLVIDEMINNYSYEQCSASCNTSNTLLVTVLQDTANDFDYQVNANVPKDIHTNCINLCSFLNEIFKEYSGKTLQDIKASYEKAKAQKANAKCTNSISCRRTNDHNIQVCSSKTNALFYNRIDGCSIPGVVNWSFAYADTVLLSACNGHDACYHCNPTRNGDKESVSMADYLSCNNIFRQNAEDACSSYNYGSKLETLAGKIKCLQEVESMVLAVDVAGWNSFSNDRSFTNSDDSGCMCTNGIRETLSGKRFLIN